MSYSEPAYNGMSLLTGAGERKYLSGAERERFIKALDILACPKERSFCETLYWTGCRPSEALALTAINIDLENASVIIRSLKKRGEDKGRHFRAIPVPREFVERLDKVHGLRQAQAWFDGGANKKLWRFGRTTGWKRTKAVMDAAGINGVKASAKGLRHGYGIHAALTRVPETRIKKWLGHASLATTEIYLDMAAPEDRSIAERMWMG